ncbi:cellulose biosynthesis cyclic di-GMP-binding regulatory protein BcsB [Chthonobacter rhizosphaerae]|uniref:cellulose biosynthesis cyclic di-GMP-binding regulatory protein BcsB n=1 Tax=Chthonobacter rhizosphaerae TaxID=2735553 RepID=UPI0015EFB8AE|nr:cellulose biosynthesis cyclic di-GMP-binding regulatory protein BcsB [Chthonobacter rhizosphaerae]
MRSILRASVSRLAAVGLAAMVPAAALAQDLPGVFDPLSPPSAVVAEKPVVIRPLPASPDELVLRGEYDRLNLPVYLSPSEAAEARALNVRISERAVSDLPESAAITVLVNGQVVSSVRGEDVAIGEDIRVPLSPGILTPGFNAVAFVVENQHRVDCTPEATYELWTRLDAQSTGFVYSVAPALTDTLASLPSVLQRSSSGGAFRLVVPAGMDAETTGAMVQAIQSVAIAGWTWKPTVTVVDAPTGAPGTEVHVVPPSAQQQLRSRGGAELSRGFWVVPAKDMPGRLDLAFVADSAGDLKAIASRIADEGRARQAEGTADGLIALGENLVRPISGETTLQLADLGFESVTFAGRRFSDDVRVALPPDFFASGYGTVKLKLEGGYSPGLTRDSELVVRVNGRVAVTLRMADGDGDSFVQQELRMPLTLFHPGINAVSFEAITRTSDDLVCDPATRTTGSGSPRFALLDTTSLEFPTLARTGSLPEMSSAVAYGFPYVKGSDPVPFYVPGRDNASLGAAATLALRMAVNLGQPVPVDLKLAQPAAAATGGIVVGPRPSLPSWLNGVAMATAPAPVREAVARPANQPAAQPVAPAPQVRQTLNPFTAPAADDGDGWLPTSLVSAVDPRTWRMPTIDVHHYFVRLAERTFGRPAAVPTAPLGAGDLVIAQAAALPPGVPAWEALYKVGLRPTTWTVVSALDEASLATGMARFAGQDGWDRAYGQRMISRADGIETEAAVTGTQVVFATQELTIGNARLTLAGWLSNKAGLYMALVVAVSALLGAIAFALARLNGAKE